MREALVVELRAKRSFAPTMEMLIPVSRAKVAICRCAAARDAGGINGFSDPCGNKNDASAMTNDRHGLAASRKFNLENETNP